MSSDVSYSEYLKHEALRDEFAKAALQALLRDSLYLTSLSRTVVAEEAYLYADAMMTARNKK